MEKTILISLPLDQLQTVIIDCVNSCLKYHQGDLTIAEDPVNTKALCTFLNITEPTLIRWRKKGKIPFLQIGSRILYQKSAVISALENRKGGKS
jgi:excisionase family DNA binding protein